VISKVVVNCRIWVCNPSSVCVQLYFILLDTHVLIASGSVFPSNISFGWLFSKAVCRHKAVRKPKLRSRPRHHYIFHFLDIHGRTSLIFYFLYISTYYPRKYSFNILIPHAHLPPLWTLAIPFGIDCKGDISLEKLG
jgi:hypothetical protein